MLFKRLKELIFNSDKIVEVLDLQYELPKDLKIPRKDEVIVKAALAKRGGNVIIITTDEKDLAKNNSLVKYLEEHGIKIILLKDAITIL